MSKTAENFWNFSVKIYQLKEVSDSCLYLQNNCGVDVNVLLCCYWHASMKGVFAEDTLSKLLSFSDQWRSEIVQPLRDTRIRLKELVLKNPDELNMKELRERIKFDELAAEKYQQEAMEGIVMQQRGLQQKGSREEESTKTADAANLNLSAYFKSAEIQIDESAQEKLLQIRRAIDTISADENKNDVFRQT